MAMLRRFVPATIATLGDREIEIRMSTAQRARDGHILEPSGCDLTNFLANPIVLFSHDVTKPVGTASDVAVEPDCIRAKVVFAPAGVSPTADEVCGLTKAGVLRGVSIGFNILDGEPIDPARPRAGLRATSWELYECTICAIPVDTGAVVTARAMADKAEWKVGAARDLPIDDSGEWDGQEAQDSIFEHAGGDDFDPVKARKGFLVYNAAKPELRGSYKLPIARVVDGELKVPKEAIRAAASRLPQTDIPDDVKEEAGKVLDAYKKKAKIGDDEEERALAARRRRMSGVQPQPRLRGLYDCAMLAYLLDQAGYLHSGAAMEAELEGDNSAVPAMLGDALQKLGAALVAMTAEEVDELLEGHNVDGLGADDDDDDTEVPAAERAFVRAGKTPRIRAWRRGTAAIRTRAGRVLSKANAARLDDAHGHLKRAANHAAKASGHIDDVGEHHDALADAHARAMTAHDKMADAIEAANGSAPADVAEKIAKVQQHHRAIGKHLDAIGERAAAIGAAQDGAEDAIEGATRAIREARRSIRSVQDAAGDDATVDDNELDDRAVAHRRREAEALALAVA